MVWMLCQLGSYYAPACSCISLGQCMYSYGRTYLAVYELEWHIYGWYQVIEQCTRPWYVRLLAYKGGKYVYVGTCLWSAKNLQADAIHVQAMRRVQQWITINVIVYIQLYASLPVWRPKDTISIAIFGVWSFQMEPGSLDPPLVCMLGAWRLRACNLMHAWCVNVSRMLNVNSEIGIIISRMISVIKLRFDEWNLE